MLDAVEMLERGEFAQPDCLWKGGRLISFQVVGDRVAPAPDIPVEMDPLADLTQLFSLTVDDTIYGGGESLSHGSFGFFFKHGAGGLEWLLFASQSDPFLGVEVTPTQVRFRSQSRDVWVVTGDDVAGTHIERGRWD